MRKFFAVLFGGMAVAAAVVLLSSSGSAARPVRGQAASSARAGSGKISFSVPTIVDPIHAFGEPTINFNIPRDQLFASGPTGTGTQRSEWLGSADGGQTFRQIVPGAVPNAIATDPGPRPGGGDTDLNFDRSGKEYFVDLYALACDRTATTSNGGKTAQESFNGCGGQLGSDRPWLAVYDPPPGTPHLSPYKGKTPLIYEEYNDLNGNNTNGGAQWNKSNDGLTFTNATTGVTTANNVTYAPFGADGYPAIDQVTGKVLQASGLSTGSTFELALNIGTPDAQGNLTFLDKPTSSGGGQNTKALIPIATNLPGSPSTLFSVLSMDSARNLFVVYTVNNTSTPADDQTWVSAASAASGWKKWTKPVQVSDGSTKTGDAVNVFPWIKAGGPGRADAVWYGSDKSADPSGNSGQKWNVFMNQLVFPVNSKGGITGQPPTTTLVKVTPHPMHYESICLSGSTCIVSQGNRNLADFFSVTVDKSGAADIIYTDTSNGLVQSGFTPGNAQFIDHSGAALVTLARQSSGMGLYGKPVHGSSSKPVSGMSDPAGDALYPVIGGKDVPGMDIRRSSLSLSPDGKTLTVTMKVVDLKSPSSTASAVPDTSLDEYVTRWQMGNIIYYAGMSTTSSGTQSFYAGKTMSVDLCSVSACDPHVLTYPEAGSGGTTEKGKVSCPAKPSASNPCTITISVSAADVGHPSASSLLEEVGAYAFATSHAQGMTTNAQAQADSVPLEIDGVCCFNFQANAITVVHHHHVPHHHHVTHHHHAHHHRVSRPPKHSRGFTG